jgi:hypothetical protein
MMHGRKSIKLQINILEIFSYAVQSGNCGVFKLATLAVSGLLDP